MHKRLRIWSALGAGVVLALVVSACGSDSDDGDSGDTASGGSWTLGTTETITAMDPAGSYDMGSWNMQYNIFQQLVNIPANGSEPEPDAATCTQDDPKTVTCTLQSGLKFSNGDDLTSSDVVFSFKRNIEIADPNGSSVLLGSISNGDEESPGLAEGAIEAPDDSTVVFHLNQPDLTFMKVLTTATASIVDEDVFPADKLLGDDQVVGSGPYKLSQYKSGEQAVLEANAEYDGSRKAKADKVFIQYFNDAPPLKQAVESGQVDIAWRTLSPTDLNSLRDGGKVDVIEGKGSEFRYWVWQLSTDAGKQKAVRQAAAQLIDRDTIAQDAYDGVVTPSYSIVPPGFSGQKDSFKDKYGDPSVDAAKQLLTDAGVQTPVKLTVGYTPTHYGPNAVDEANELVDQLNSSGLFQAKTDNAEWEQYQTLYKQGAYDIFILGWYPDFLDADNYLTPFLRNGGFFQNNYKSEEVNKLLDQQLGEADPDKRNAIIEQIQDIVAEDVPLIPSWNGKNIAVSSKEMNGVEDTLDPTYIFRFWMISKS